MYPARWFTAAALTVAVVAISFSGPLIAYAAASGLAIAFWRNAFSVVAIGPAAAVTRRGELRGMRPRVFLVCALAGVALAVHFATWVPSVKLTAVATATALAATQPVWQGLIALGQGRRLPALVWIGIGLAVGGAALAAGFDLAVDTRAFAGDVLAVLGGMAAAVYTAFGERARTELSTTSYTAVCYTVCAAVLLLVCLVAGVPLHGFAGTTWLAILGMTLGPQLLGHSMFSYALRGISATTVAVLILLEVPGAALISWLWLGATPPVRQWPGLALLVAGVVVVVLGSRRVLNTVGASPVEASAS